MDVFCNPIVVPDEFPNWIPELVFLQKYSKVSFLLSSKKIKKLKLKLI